MEKRGRPRKKPDMHSQGPELLRLLRKDKGNGPPPALYAEQMLLFKAQLEKKPWRTGKQAYAWLRENFGVSFIPNGFTCILKKLGARLKVPRSSHPKKDPEAGIVFKETLCQQLID
ncbi:MAG: winged helix-turn-helix domain-containing protein, partial [Chthoniobacterales bacterium]